MLLVYFFGIGRFACYIYAASRANKAGSVLHNRLTRKTDLRQGLFNSHIRHLSIRTEMQRTARVLQ